MRVPVRMSWTGIRLRQVCQQGKDSCRGTGRVDESLRTRPPPRQRTPVSSCDGCAAWSAPHTPLPSHSSVLTISSAGAVRAGGAGGGLGRCGRRDHAEHVRHLLLDLAVLVLL